MVCEDKLALTLTYIAQLQLNLKDLDLPPSLWRYREEDNNTIYSLSPAPGGELGEIMISEKIKLHKN